MRAEYLNYEGMTHVLAMLTHENRLVAEVMLHTGLRVGDVLELRREDIKPRMSVTEHKTGKRRRIALTADLVRRLRGKGTPGWCFPNQRDPAKHRTRQAVWKDFKRAASILRYRENVTPHSCRKNYAVAHFKEHGLEATQRVLNHSNPNCTMFYAMADILASGKHRQRRRLKE